MNENDLDPASHRQRPSRRERILTIYSHEAGFVSWLSDFWVEVTVTASFALLPLVIYLFNYLFDAPPGWDQTRTDLFNQNPLAGAWQTCIGMWSPTQPTLLAALQIALAMPFFKFAKLIGPLSALMCLHFTVISASVLSLISDPAQELRVFPMTLAAIAGCGVVTSLSLPRVQSRIINILVCAFSFFVSILPFDNWLPFNSALALMFGMLFGGLANWRKLETPQFRTTAILSLAGSILALSYAFLPLKLDQKAEVARLQKFQDDWREIMSQGAFELSMKDIDFDSYKQRVERAVIARIIALKEQLEKDRSRYTVESDIKFVDARIQRLQALSSVVEAAVRVDEIRYRLISAYNLTQEPQIDGGPLGTLLDQFWQNDLTDLRQTLEDLDELSDLPGDDDFWIRLRQIRSAVARDIDALTVTGVEIEVIWSLAWARNMRTQSNQLRITASSSRSLKSVIRSEVSEKVKRLESIQQKQSSNSQRLSRLLSQLHSLRESLDEGQASD